MAELHGLPGLEIDRFDSAEWFECSRCHKRTDLIDGGDECPEDPAGDMCSACWCERRRADEFADRVMQAAQPHELIDVEPGDGVVRLHAACPSLEFQLEDAEELIERIREAIEDARGRRA